MKLKIFQALQDLSTTEVKSITEFMAIKYGHQSDIFRLVQKITENKEEQLILKNIHQEHFNHLTRKSFLNLSSRAFSGFEDWLVFHTCTNDPYQKKVILLKAYNRRGLFELADKHFRRTERLFNSNPNYALERNHTLYKLRHYHYFSENPVKYRKKGQLLDEMTNYFLQYIKDYSLLYLAEIQNWSSITGYDFTRNKTFLKSINKTLPNAQTTPLLEQILDMVLNMNAQSFYALKNILDNNMVDEESDLYPLLYFYLINIGTILWRRDLITNPDVFLDVFKQSIEKKVLLQKGMLANEKFFHIISALNEIFEGDEKYELVDQMSQYLSTTNNEEIRVLGHLRCMIHDERFEEMLPIIRSINPNPYRLKLFLYSLELMALYELRKEYYPVLKNKIYNYKRTLKLEKDKEQKKNIVLHSNFIKAIEDLLRADYKKTHIEISKYAPVANKYWLHKKVEAINNR